MDSSVTVIIFVKNKQDTIEKCVRSVIDNNSNKKIIVVDNFSTDNSLEILKKFSPAVRLLRMKGGLSEMANKVIMEVDTEYIAFTDADCVVSKNWLKELILPFAGNKDVVATAGYCGTPKDVGFLQKIIGLELENRFKNFPQYIERAPTMNLCVKTDAIQKIKFDEIFSYQAWETDFGYRLTKLGKIYYTPRAIVDHYHRSTLKSFFVQQKNQAKWGVKLFFKHGKKSLGDSITTPLMVVQIPFLFFALLFLLLSWMDMLFFPFSVLLFLVLFTIYFKNIKEIKPSGIEYLPFFGLFIFRNVSWLVGVAEGFFQFFGDIKKFIFSR